MKDGVIAVVAGKEIKQEEFDLFVENLPQDRKAYLQYPGFKERLLDQYLALYTFRQMQLSRVWIRLRNLHVFWRIPDVIFWHSLLCARQ